MPRKAFAFGPDSEEVLEDLLEAYLLISALCEVLEAIVAGAGLRAPPTAATIADCDELLVRAIQKWPRTTN